MLTFLLALVPAGVAAANEPASQQSRLLVLQAISLIANGAAVDQVVDRLSEAEQAPDPEGVDLASVARARSVITAGNGSADALRQARPLLEGAISVRAATGYGPVPAPGQVGAGAASYAVGAQSGTEVVLDELRPSRGVSDRGDAVLLSLAAGALILGAYLARRWRPAASIRELRRGATGIGGGR